MPDDRLQKQIAYSRIEIKAFDDSARTFEGIASTPTPDRMDDIVEPLGAKFTLPLPLLWQHDSCQPVGQITEAKATKDGITVKGVLAQVPEPASLKDDLDRAWAMLKSGLVRGLSIGFMPIESEPIDPKNPWFGGTRFIEWDFYELSLVTIPANAEASITAIKSADQRLRAASGAKQSVVVRLSSPPGASGKPKQIPKEIQMKPTAEQISSFENKRAASSARMQEIMAKSGDEGRTLDSTETEEYDALAAEVKAVDAHLVRLKAHQEAMASQARPVDGSDAPIVVRAPSITGVTPPKLEPGIKFARWARSFALAKGNLNDAVSYINSRKDWAESSPELKQMGKLALSIGTADLAGWMHQKATVTGGDTVTSGWASELVYAQNVQSEFIEYLRPRTVLGKIDALVPFRRVPFNVRMGSMTGGTTGYWVGQGAPIALSKPTTGSATLGITKLAGMSVFDDELLRSSSPSVDMLLRDDLAAAVQAIADTSFVDPTQGGVANVQPASVTYNVTANIASGTDYAAIKTDVKAAFSGMITANQGIAGGVWAMSETTALALSLMQNSLGQQQFPGMTPTGGTWLGLPVVTSQALLMAGSPDYGNLIVLVFPREIFLADDGQVSIEISNQASIQMLDNPTNNAQAGTATTVVSMFQDNAWAIRAIRYINWKVRGTRTAVGMIRSNAYN